MNSRSVPSSFLWLGEIAETDQRGQEDMRRFYAYGSMLVILSEYTSRTRVDPGTGEPEMTFDQLDFPMDTASWLVSKLERFGQGGMLPGTITQYETVIAGEDINLDRVLAMAGPDVPGWELVNYSRRFRHDDIDRFQAFPMTDPFLWEHGMFDLWKRIAERHKQGEF